MLGLDFSKKIYVKVMPLMYNGILKFIQDGEMSR